MMTKKKTPKIRWVRFTWALPMVALLLFAFAEPNYKSSEKLVGSENLISQEIEWKNPVKMHGLVLDENGDPLPGTSVVIKGSTIGTVCDINGKFKLEVPENSIIVMSFVGMRTIEDTYKGITTGYKKDGVFNRKYNMAVEVIYASACFDDSDTPPPPPPPAKTKSSTPPPPLPGKAEKTKLKEGEKEQEVFFIVESMPEFPGGSRALSKYIQNLTEQYNLEGKAKIGFTVNNKGSVTEVKIVESDSEKIGKSAAEIIGKLPIWKPGMQRGKPVPVKFLIAVEFK